MTGKLECSSREIRESALPAFAEDFEVVAIAREKGNAARGHIETAKNDELQRAAVSLHANTPRDPAFMRAANFAGAREDARSWGASAADSFRSQRADEWRDGCGIDVHMMVRIGVRRRDAAS